jgi:hypothetical protein
MKLDNKSYAVVFLGLVLACSGIAIRALSDKKNSAQSQRAALDAQKSAARSFAPKKSNDIEDFRATIILKTKPRNLRTRVNGLNFVFEKSPGPLPLDAGHRNLGRDILDGALLECSDECVFAGVGKGRAIQSFKNPLAPQKTVRGDVRVSRRGLARLAPDTHIIGNLYISGLTNIRIPRGLSISGNIYIDNSRNVRFMGRNLVDGNVFLRGNSSVKSLGRDVILTGQIFI